MKLNERIQSVRDSLSEMKLPQPKKPTEKIGRLIWLNTETHGVYTVVKGQTHTHENVSFGRYKTQEEADKVMEWVRKRSKAGKLTYGDMWDLEDDKKKI